MLKQRLGAICTVSSATRTLQDAKDIAAQPAPPHAKRFYTHLRSFVRTLKLPRRATRSELYVYDKVRFRFGNDGQPPVKAVRD